MPVTLTHRIGLRGFVLLILGLAYVALGISQLAKGPYGQDQLFVYQVPPFWVFPAVWMIAGALMAVSAFRAVGADKLGFILGFAAPTVQAVAELAGWVTWVSTEHARGESNGYANAVIFALVAVLVMRLSGAVDPDRSEVE